MNGHALKPIQWDLLIRACEKASMTVAHTDVSLGAALDAACRRLGYVLDDDSYQIAIVSLAKYRAKLSIRRVPGVSGTPETHSCEEPKTGEQP